MDWKTIKQKQKARLFLEEGFGINRRMHISDNVTVFSTHDPAIIFIQTVPRPQTTLGAGHNSDLTSKTLLMKHCVHHKIHHFLLCCKWATFIALF